MKISTKGRYAVRMMLDLALHDDGYVALKDIAARQEISKKYLEQIVPPLHRAGLLKTGRGYLGGYCLSRPPKDYSIGEILRATEGDMSPVACLKDDSVQCSRRTACMTLSMWRGLSRVIQEYLDGITLQDLIDHANESPDRPPDAPCTKTCPEDTPL